MLVLLKLRSVQSLQRVKYLPAMAKRSVSNADPKALSKVMMCAYVKMKEDLFQLSVDACLERRMGFLVDLWNFAMYPLEWKLGKAIFDAWPELGASAAKLTAKYLKALLRSIHYKRRRMSSGQKTSDPLRRFLNLVGDGQDCQVSLPVAAEPTAVAAKKVACDRPATEAVASAKTVSAQAAVPTKAVVSISAPCVVFQPPAALGSPCDHN